MIKITKKERAKEIYQKNHTLPRKQLIDLVMKELNTSENSARTHISNASKELNLTLGKSFASRNTLKPTLKKVRARDIVLANYTALTRKELAEKLMKELNLKTMNSAHTHISHIIKEHGLS